MSESTEHILLCRLNLTPRQYRTSHTYCIRHPGIDEHAFSFFPAIVRIFWNKQPATSAQSPALQSGLTISRIVFNSTTHNSCTTTQFSLQLHFHPQHALPICQHHQLVDVGQYSKKILVMIDEQL